MISTIVRNIIIANASWLGRRFVFYFTNTND
jgi:hypothetical protein